MKLWILAWEFVDINASEPGWNWTYPNLQDSIFQKVLLKTFRNKVSFFKASKQLFWDKYTFFNHFSKKLDLKIIIRGVNSSKIESWHIGWEWQYFEISMPSNADIFCIAFLVWNFYEYCFLKIKMFNLVVRPWKHMPLKLAENYYIPFCLDQLPTIEYSKSNFQNFSKIENNFLKFFFYFWGQLNIDVHSFFLEILQ